MYLRLFSVHHVLLLTQHQQSPDGIPLRDFLALDLHGNYYCVRACRAQIARLQVLCHLVSEGTHGQGIAMTENESKCQKYLCMLFHPSIHSFFVNKFDVSYLTLTIVRRREIHMRNLNNAAVDASAKSWTKTRTPLFASPKNSRSSGSFVVFGRRRTNSVHG
jgi:hypothetical protein